MNDVLLMTTCVLLACVCRFAGRRWSGPFVLLLRVTGGHLSPADRPTHGPSTDEWSGSGDCGDRTRRACSGSARYVTVGGPPPTASARSRPGAWRSCAASYSDRDSEHSAAAARFCRASLGRPVRPTNPPQHVSATAGVPIGDLTRQQVLYFQHRSPAPRPSRCS